MAGMQARRLVISKGIETGQPIAPRRAPTPPPPRPQAAPAATPEPAADLHLVHHRLVALERLTALHEKGVLSAEEFAAEKALVLRIPAEELMLEPAHALPPRGPSLLGRLLNPKLIAAGVVAGLALSAYTQPQELAALLRTFG